VEIGVVDAVRGDRLQRLRQRRVGETEWLEQQRTRDGQAFEGRFARNHAEVLRGRWAIVGVAFPQPDAWASLVRPTFLYVDASSSTGGLPLWVAGPRDPSTTVQRHRKEPTMTNLKTLAVGVTMAIASLSVF